MTNGEIITVAVGQCGNQLSRVFWELAEQERAQCREIKVPDYEESSLFRSTTHTNFHPTLRARSILVDTEPAVRFLTAPSLCYTYNFLDCSPNKIFSLTTFNKTENTCSDSTGC